MVIDPQTAYLIAKTCYRGSKFAYKRADKRVGAWAEEQEISKEEAWRMVRAEAIKRGDVSVERAADVIISMGWKVSLVPGGNVLLIAAHGWKAVKKRL